MLFSQSSVSASNIDIVKRILDTFFPNPSPPLIYSDPFTLLIAVLLSAMCTDERVNRVTPALFAKASTPEAMARLSVETIQGLIKPCGLSLRKATAIRQLSRDLVKRFGGEVPRSLEELESLPGVGHKTASVVVVQAFGIPAFPVDRHIFRSARRWGLSSSTTVGGVEADLKNLFPKKEWAKRHLQIILFARQYCTAARHKVERCPICSALQNANCGLGLYGI
jgi:endonuclease III